MTSGNPEACETAFRTLTASAVTSLPIPSPAMTATRTAQHHIRAPPPLRLPSSHFTWHTWSCLRIVCLTEETTETLYRLGAGDLVVGVSGYTARPPEARQKPKVSAFINAKFDKILALEPDLVLAFS